MIRKLPILIIHPHSLCNCRCAMCDIWRRKSLQEIGAEQFDRQLADIESLGVEWVVFSGGEPLLHADLFRKAAELRRRQIRVTLLSSGLLLSRYVNQITRNFDELIVSLDGPRDVHNRIRGVLRAFELLATGVEKLRAERHDYPIAARCTVQRANCAHLKATVEAARELGLDSLSFLACDIHSGAFNRQPGFASEAHESLVPGIGQLPVLDEQIEEVIASGDCGGFVLESPQKLKRVARHFRCCLGLEAPVSPQCNAPWVSAVIEADGAVRPCFFHKAIGSLGDNKGLEAVLNGPAASEFRAGLDIANNPICQRCTCSLNLKA